MTTVVCEACGAASTDIALADWFADDDTERAASKSPRRPAGAGGVVEPATLQPASIADRPIAAINAGKRTAIFPFPNDKKR